MTEDEYKLWYEASWENYKQELIRNGLTIEEAHKKTDDDFSRLLPGGLKSIDQHLFSIKAGSTLVGSLWFAERGAPNNRKAFIYDIVLNDSARGKGYGKKAMGLLETEVKKLGLRHIGLHVFGHNLVARSLYEKAGYVITNLNMEKEI